MILTFKQRRIQPNRITQEWDLYIEDQGIRSRAGLLLLTDDEIEILKATLIEGQARWQEGEACFQFLASSETEVQSRGERIGPNLSETMESSFG